MSNRLLVSVPWPYFLFAISKYRPKEIDFFKDEIIGTVYSAQNY